MKTILSILCVAVLATVPMSAQVQTNKQKKTTVKKVRVTDNNQISTKVVEDVNADIDVIEVEGTDELNQKVNVVKKNADQTSVVGGEDMENVENKLKVAEKMKAQETALQQSKKMQMEKAEKERLALEKMKKQMMEDMKKRRMELEKRPKGIVKLRDPDGDGIN